MGFEEAIVRKRRELGLQPACHASSRIHGARNRVGANVAIPTSKLDVDNLEVVDVFEILADRGFCMVGAAFTEDNVASDAFGDSVGVMARDGLVALRPADTDLACLVNGITTREM